jgi:NADPH-dependent 2,4-dienoyl-CoA reductase/sulfur reductase-like enzyme
MSRLTRRDFAKALGGAGLAASTTTRFATFAIAQGGGKVVIIGGGPGGATVANQLRRGDPKLEVILVEPKTSSTTCFFSNLYLGGFRTLDSITHDYSGLAKQGVRVVHDVATAVDPQKKTVALKGGDTLAYDRLVLSPGIDIKYGSIEGYSEQAAEMMPHAWQAGAQTQLLKKKLEALDDGGVVVMAAPDNPYRCPPGPYERACMIGHFLKTQKPKAKLIIFDPKKTFSKQAVFTEAFDKYYKGIIELNLTNEIDDFTVVRVDAKSGEVLTKAGRREKADVANIVPNQRAGAIAHQAGCAEGDWCPVNFENFTSTKVPGVYVLGDAAIAPEMPKSAFTANSQAKVVAADILAELSNKDRFPARYRNTCWSMVAPDDSIKIGANYAPGEKDGKKLLAPSGSFVSQLGEDADLRKATFQESLGWYSGIVTDVFAKS